MKYTIKNPKIRHIESINKDLYEAGAVDETGKIYEKVTMWKTDWPQEVTNDLVVLGEIKETEKNGYKNFTLYPERTNTLGRKGGSNISKLMEKKDENIRAAQERKNDSIAYFNAVNSAIGLFSSLKDRGVYTELVSTDIGVQEFIRVWRDWFLSEWQKYDAKGENEKRIPF